MKSSVKPSVLYKYMNSVQKKSKVYDIGIEDEILKDKFHLCTLCGKDYLYKIIALHQSIKTYSSQTILWIVCIDDITYQILKKCNLTQAIVIPLTQLIGSFSAKEQQELCDIKFQRKTNEFCWTLKAPLIEYVLEHPSVERTIYIDSDLFFFDNPELLFKDWGNESIYLCTQRDADWVEKKYGHYQAGCIGFANTPVGVSALSWWKKVCLEWCFFTYDSVNMRWGDQLYLERIPQQFREIKISRHLGIDAAPWNIIYNNDFNLTKADNKILIENQPLVVFHFACLDVFDKDSFDLWSLAPIQISGFVKQNIYLPYLKAIQEVIDVIDPQLGEQRHRTYSTKPSINAKNLFTFTPLSFTIHQYDKFFCTATTVKETSILAFLAYYHSINRFTEQFQVYVCTMDTTSYDVLKKLNLPHATLLPVSTIETPLLLTLKKDKKLEDYELLVKAPLCKHLLTNYPINHIFFHDATLCFYSNPLTLFAEWEGYSIYLTQQNGSEEVDSKYGRYHSGCIGFRNDPTGHSILDWWFEQCMDWCEAKQELYRYGDQKYLDAVPHLFTAIYIPENKGINMTPYSNYKEMKKNFVSKKEEIGSSPRPFISFNFMSPYKYHPYWAFWELDAVPHADHLNAILEYYNDIIAKVTIQYQSQLQSHSGLLNIQEIHQPILT